MTARRHVKHVCRSALAVTAVLSAHVALADDELFERNIRPVLAGTCFRCHGDQKTSGGLRVDSRAALLTGGESGPAIVPGNPGESLLLKALLRDDDVSAMPPDKAVVDTTVAAFEAWIRAGAPWPATAPAFESDH